MTNREWLESLSNDDLARQFIKATSDCRRICSASVYSTCGISTVGYTCTDGMAMWLNEEHKEDIKKEN